MALALKIDVVTAKFDNMLNEMARIDPAVEFSTIVRQMAIRVIQGAANRTHTATIESIERNENARFITKEWTTIEGKKYLIKGTGSQGHTNRYPDWLWNGILALRKQDLEKRIARKSAERGLAKQSWLQLAISLGGTIDVPGYVRDANYKGRQYPGDVSWQQDSANGRYGLTIINSSPIAKYAGGLGALLGAMQGEIGYFNQNMAHGFYQTLASRAAKYPGIFATEGSVSIATG